MKTLRQHIYSILLILLMSLVGCSVPAASTLSPTSTLTSPTSTPMVLRSPTPSPELPTDMPTPSLVPPTRTPNPTPAPTMTADEEYAFVSKMLRNNGGCQLPCWWGFTPGETSWEMTKTFFVSRGQKIWGGDDNIQNYTIVCNTPGYYEGYQSYIGKDGLLNMIGVSAVPPVGEDGYYMHNPQFAQDWNAYMVPQILEVYGAPSQIFIGTGGAPWSPFDLLLFYPEKGFLVQYSGVAEEREKKPWLVCPHRAELALYLWSPERSMNLEDIPGVVSAHTDDKTWGPYPLEEATGMSIEQFYQTFTQPGNQTCLEAPADLW